MGVLQPPNVPSRSLLHRVEDLGLPGAARVDHPQPSFRLQEFSDARKSFRGPLFAGEQGRRILLVDLDPQASASTWFGIKGKGKGLYEVFTNSRTLSELIQQSEVARVEVIPSTSWLNGIEKVLAGEVEGMTSSGETLGN